MGTSTVPAGAPVRHPPGMEGLYDSLAFCKQIASTAKSGFGLGWFGSLFFLFSFLAPVCVEAEATITIVLVRFVRGRYQ